METRRDYMRAELSPFSEVDAKWEAVAGSTSDYIIEDELSGTCIRVVESVIDCGFHVGGSFKDGDVVLSRPETSEALALLVSSSLLRNLEGHPDHWVVSLAAVERLRTKAIALASKWEPTSVMDLHVMARTLGPHEAVVRTLRCLYLLERLPVPFRLACRVVDSEVHLIKDVARRRTPAGIFYGVTSHERANDLVTQLISEGLIGVVESVSGRAELSVLQKGIAAAQGELRLQSRISDVVADLLDGRNHPGPDMTDIVSDQGLASAISRRWKEADECHRAGSYFAATILIASILEGCLLARVQRACRHNYEFRKVPEKKSTGSPEEWGLANLLSVAANEGWIRKDRHLLGHVLKDARNLVHPGRITSEESEVDERSAKMYWEILQGVVEDLARTKGD